MLAYLNQAVTFDCCCKAIWIHNDYLPSANDHILCHRQQMSHISLSLDNLVAGHDRNAGFQQIPPLQGQVEVTSPAIQQEIDYPPFS